MFYNLPFRFFWTILVVSLPFVGWTQPANDECAGAIQITDLKNFCSTKAAYTNESATPTNFENTSGKDVWFRFTAVASHVTINIVGRSDGGTLRSPEVELYVDNQCEGTFTVLKSAASNFANVSELNKGGLIPGGSYLFRVQGDNDREGTFQLCINNYFPPEEPGSDLEVAAMLCDKSSFVVERIEGAGADGDEAAGTCLDAGGGGIFGSIFGTDSEQSSTWLTWIAENDGTLEFTLFPINPSDDLDFVVFELPDGINQSGDKIPLRCMATACVGPTGLKEESVDVEEDSNCDAGEDGFVKAIDMKAGVAYGLLINNFSESGNGFTIEFAGTGAFQGPEPQIDAFIDGQIIQEQTICAGEQVAFDGSASSFALGDIVAYEWIFGVGASPETSDQANPGLVTYNEPGVKTIALTITTALGCKISEVREAIITVNPCCDINGVEGVGQVIDVGCEAQNGAINFTAVSNLPIEEYEWNMGFTTAAIADIPMGAYSLTVTNTASCTAAFEYQIAQVADFELTPIVTQPICGAMNSGAVLLQITTEAFSIAEWSDGLGTGTEKRDLAAGEYSVTVTNEAGCSKTETITLHPPTELTLNLMTNEITCAGEADASISAMASGGTGNMEYRWSNDARTATISELSEGIYSLTVVDDMDCEVVESITITNPLALSLTVEQVSIPCFGIASGAVRVNTLGGTGNVEYSVDNGAFQTNLEVTNLSAGEHLILVKDGMGCIATETIILEAAAPLELSLSAADEVLNLGNATRLNAIVPSSAGPISYEWSPAAYLDCADCPRPTAMPVNNTIFEVTVTDENNCTASAQINIRVDTNREIYIPTAFTPDGDGKNEGFTIMGSDAAERIVEFKVFDRWGNMVFETLNIPLGAENLGWDGRFKGQLVQSDVFVYYAIVQFRDGVTEQFAGDVLVLR